MKYKGHKIPKALTKETVLAFLEIEQCRINEGDCGVSRCFDCIFSTLGLLHTTRAAKYQSIIEYGVNKGLLSKGEALKFTLDKN